MPPSPDRPPPRAWGRAWAAAGLFAAAEPGLALALGLLAWGRAETLIFLALRPWLLLVLVLALAGLAPRVRWTGYVAALVLATAGETWLLYSLGDAAPWSGAVRGLVAGLLLAGLVDLGVQAARRWRGGVAGMVAGLAFGAAFLLPGGLWLFERVAVPNEAEAPASARPPLLVLTSLPIVWGEAGPFDGGSAPAAAYRFVGEGFDLRPIDAVDAASLQGARLMLLAQPRLLAPDELVRLDGWVRGGGRVLVLADETLDWPSELPPGDLRRPVERSTLSGLLDHWGVRAEAGGAAGLVTPHMQVAGRVRRLRTTGLGTLAVTSPDCRLVEAWLARCAVGRGTALVLADADLLHDRTWTGAGGETARHLRTGDNPMIVEAWLRALGGTPGWRGGDVVWAMRAPGRVAVLGAFLPALLGLALAGVVGLRSRGRT